MEDLAPALFGEQLPVVDTPVGEEVTTPENLRRDARFIAYGSRMSGAQELVLEIRKQLEENGQPDVEICMSRDVSFIEDVFYNRERRGQPKPYAQKALGSLVSTSEAQLLNQNTLPQGVLIFPEMRQYSPMGPGMTIPTPYERIEELCARQGVPFVHVERLETVEEIEQALHQLNPAPDNKLPPIY
jgi:hypothetical protein